MANNYDVKDNTYTHVGVPFNYTRGNPLPIDNSSVWTTLSDAQNYALSSPVSYVGQIITVNNGAGVSAFVIENTAGNLKMLATGGDAAALEAKLNQEIIDRGAADTYISGKVDTVSTDLDTLEAGSLALSGRVDVLEADRTTLSTNLGNLSGDFITLKDTTIPLSVANLQSSLSVTVEKLATPSTSAYIATYVVKQGGTQVGSAIDIPRDFLVKNAEVKVCEKDDVPVAGFKKGDKYIDFTINAEGGTGGEKHIYVNLKDLTDIYKGGNTSTVSVEVSSDNTIFATVNSGSIGFEHITSGLSAHIKGIRTDVDQVSTDLGLSVTALEGKIGTARTDLCAYARETSAAALVDAKAYTDAEITGLTASISAGTVGEAQKVFTKITQTNGVVAAESMQLAIKDINGLSTAIAQVESNAKTYTDGKLDALDWTNNIGATQRVKSISQKDGAISVEAESMTLAHIANAYNDLTAILSNEYDAKGSASTAESNAKAYTDALSTAVNGKLATEKSEREAGDSALSAYARETSATALADAKKYTDEKVAGLSVEVIKSDLCAYARETSAASFEASKGYANSISTALSTDYVGKIDALEAKAATSVDNALTAAKAYTNGVSAGLSTDYVAKINALEAKAATSVDNALTAAKAYTDGISTALSTDYVAKIAAEAQLRVDLSGELKSDISAEKTRAQGIENEISGKLGTLSASFQTVSADHAGRLSTVEGKVAKLSSAMHFKGVNLTAELSTGSTTVPVPPYKTGETPEAGDVVIVKDSKEFVWALSSDLSTSGMWYELGAEGVWATKTALEAEVTRAKADEQTISAALTSETSRAKAAEGTISGVVDTLSGDLYGLSSEVALSVGNLTSTISGEESTRAAVDTFLSGKIDNKVKIGTGSYDGTSATYSLSQSDLSVVKIADEDYYKMIAAGKQNDNVVYIVSSDYVNGHDQRVINVGSAISATDAVNLSGMNAAIDAAKAEIVANSLSGVTLNGESFSVANNVASLQISCIYCGGAD